MQGSEVYKMLSATPEFPKAFPMLYTYGTPVKRMTRKLIGREKQLRQLKAGLLRPELCNVLLLGDAGSGKALANGTLIPVNDDRGYVPIENLCVGDNVFDENGNSVPVLGVFPQGKKKAFKVTLSDGTSVVCNDEHLWSARTRTMRYRNGEFKTHTLADMMNNGISKNLAAGNVVYNWYIPLPNALKRKEVSLPVHPYVMGVLAGDRYLYKADKSSQLILHQSDEAVVRRVAKLIGADDIERTKGENKWLFIHKAASVRTSRYITLDDLAAMFDFYCIFEAGRINCRIPKLYMTGSIEQRYELLQGLMDSAGTVASNSRLGCTFTTASKGVAEDFLQLITSLGIRGKKIRNKLGDYEIRILIDSSRKQDLFKCEAVKQKIQTYQRADKKYTKNYEDIAITNVQSLKCDTEMTCIYVGSPNHLFLATENHIVTHNTALVQGSMAADTSRIYLEIDISKMIADLRDNNEMAVKIKALFDESAKFVKESGVEIVLFIDEFHLICMLSDAAVEALKPMLADSGTRGVRVIVATTFTEFRQYISANQPLVQRLQRIEILPPAKEAIVSILQSFAKIYGVADEIHGTALYEQIIELSNRYIPANSQPRKSILLLDLMVGWYRSEPGTKMDLNLLYDVLRYSEGIELNVHVDAVGIKKRLDSKVFAQYLATSAVASRLQITSADLNNKTKPMGSFLFTGSTGVGKTELTKQLAEILFADPKRLIRFDMTEYSQPQSIERFRVEVTTKVWERPYSVLLFDEIEKACGDVTRILLQVLDDGRLIDQNNREVSFLNTYIVLTTNAASEIYETIGDYVNDEDATDEEQIRALGKYMKVIRRAIVEGTGNNKFPPELLGRIDAICPFMPLSEDTQRKILEKRMDKLRDEVKAKHNLKLSYATEDILRYILRDKLDTESNSGGARIVATKFEEEVVIEVARIINIINSNTDSELTADNIIGIRVEVEGNMAVDDKHLLEGDAYIAAYPVNIDNKVIKTRKKH